MIDTSLIDRVYTELMELMVTTLNERYYQIKLDPELYDKVIASVTEDTLKVAATIVQQQLSINGQLTKLDADISFIVEQEQSLTDSVLDNRRIKAMKSYADLIGTLGAGGLTVTTEMWTTMYRMILGLNDSGSEPVATNIIKVANTNFV